MIKKAVVLGSTGFVGRYLSAELVSQGFHVTGVSSREKPTEIERGGAQLSRELDVSEPEQLESLLHPGSTLISCLPSTSPAQEGVQPWFDSPDFLNRLLCVASEKQVARFAYCSSGGTVYGEQTLDSPWDEDSSLLPISLYGLAKVAGEKAVSAECRSKGIYPIIWRFSNLYGLGQPANSGQGIIATALDRAIKSEAVGVFGAGNMVRDFVHVIDAARAAALTLQKNPNHNVYNIGTGRGHSINAVLELVEQALGMTVRRRQLGTPKSFVKRNILSNRRISQEFPDLKFRTLERGIPELALELYPK